MPCMVISVPKWWDDHVRPGVRHCKWDCCGALIVVPSTLKAKVWGFWPELRLDCLQKEMAEAGVAGIDLGVGWGDEVRGHICKGLAGPRDRWLWLWSVRAVGATGNLSNTRAYTFKQHSSGCWVEMAGIETRVQLRVNVIECNHPTMYAYLTNHFISYFVFLKG